MEDLLEVCPSKLDLIKKSDLLCIFMVKYLKRLSYVCAKWIYGKDRIWQTDKSEITNQAAGIEFSCKKKFFECFAIKSLHSHSNQSSKSTGKNLTC